MPQWEQKKKRKKRKETFLARKMHVFSRWSLEKRWAHVSEAFNKQLRFILKRKCTLGVPVSFLDSRRPSLKQTFDYNNLHRPGFTEGEPEACTSMVDCPAAFWNIIFVSRVTGDGEYEVRLILNPYSNKRSWTQAAWTTPYILFHKTPHNTCWLKMHTKKKDRSTFGKKYLFF